MSIPMSLTTRVIAGICLFALLLSGGMYAGGTLILRQAETALLGLNARNARGAVDAVLRQAERNLVLQGRGLSRDRDATALVASGDKAGLSAHMLGAFNRMTAAGDITDMVFFDAQGQVLSAQSSLEGAAPETAPAAVTEAMETGRRVFMLDRLGADRFVIAYAFPVLKGRNTVGYALIANAIRSNLPGISETIGGDALLAAIGPDGAGQIIDHAVFDAAPDAAPEDRPAPLPSQDLLTASLAGLDRAASDFAQIALGATHAVVTRYRLGAAETGGFVDLLLFADFTQEHLTQTARMRQVGMGIGALSLLVLFAMLFWLRAQLWPLRENARALAALAAGQEPAAPRHRSSATEIAELAGAMDRFMAKRSKETAAFGEISAVVAACAQGDFSRRIAPDSSDDMLAALCRGVNDIGASADTGLVQVQTALTHLQQGDLRYRMSGDYAGIFAEIAIATNAANDELSRTLSEIATASFDVGATTKELTAVAETLATGTETNAAQLEQTASTLQDIAVTVESSAETARKTQATVQAIDGKATDGRDLMGQTVAAMHDIEKSADAIDNIVSVIEDLAFQTNLLALNAGVEAARAGESGRGFAVVASEVRALAQRSSESALEVKDLVAASGRNVKEGAKLVETSGAAFNDIVEGIAAIREMIGSIASDAGNTARNVGEISQATDQLRNATQQNAAVSEEANAAVMSVQAQVDQMSAAIARFQFDDPADREGPNPLRRAG